MCVFACLQDFGHNLVKYQTCDDCMISSALSWQHVWQGLARIETAKARAAASHRQWSLQRAKALSSPRVESCWTTREWGVSRQKEWQAITLQACRWMDHLASTSEAVVLQVQCSLCSTISMFHGNFRTAASNPSRVMQAIHTCAISQVSTTLILLLMSFGKTTLWTDARGTSSVSWGWCTGHCWCCLAGLLSQEMLGWNTSFSH